MYLELTRLPGPVSESLGLPGVGRAACLGTGHCGYGPFARPGSKVKLREIEDDIWLGDNETFEIAPENSFRGRKSDASWLPGKEIAELWQELVQ